MMRNWQCTIKAVASMCQNLKDCCREGSLYSEQCKGVHGHLASYLPPGTVITNGIKIFDWQKLSLIV